MTDKPNGSNEPMEEVKVLATLIRHIQNIRANLHMVTSEFERRSIVHDLSKFRPDELSGFVEIQKVAREHPIGSIEYEKSMRDAECIRLHFSRNSHHPEYHESTKAMGWLDIIEMVCDWKAAADTYGTNSLRSSLGYQQLRHGFTKQQWWLINQVVDFLEAD